MTTRDTSIRTLAEALDAIGRPVPVVPLLTASTTLAADLDLGTAWRLAVAALPSGWMLEGVYQMSGDDGWHAAAIGPWGAEDQPTVAGWGDTPVAALDALRAALEAR